MDPVIRRGFCQQMNNVMEVSALISDNKVLKLACPLRSEYSPCGHVDGDRLRCCLLPEHEILESALYPMPEPE